MVEFKYIEKADAIAAHENGAVWRFDRGVDWLVAQFVEVHADAAWTIETEKPAADYRVAIKCRRSRKPSDQRWLVAR